MKWITILATLMASNLIFAQTSLDEMVTGMVPGLKFENVNKPGDGSSRINGLTYTQDGITYSIGTDTITPQRGVRVTILNKLCVALGFEGAAALTTEKRQNVDVAYLSENDSPKLTLRQEKEALIVTDFRCYNGSDLPDLQVRTVSVNAEEDSMTVTDPTIEFDGNRYYMVSNPLNYYNHGVCRVFGYEESSKSTLTPERNPETPYDIVSFTPGGYVVGVQNSTMIGSMSSLSSGSYRLEVLTCRKKIKDIPFTVLE